MKTFTRLALAAGLAMSTAAVADTVTIRYDNPVFSLGHDTVSLSDNGGASSFGVYAGQFEATVLSHTGAITDAAFVDSKNDLYLYCYDIFQHIANGQTLTYTLHYNGATARTLDFLGAVNYVLNGNSNTWTDPFAWLHPASTDIGVAIQAGIWESLYDTSSDWKLGSGNFRVTGLNSGTSSEYALFRNAVLNPAVSNLAQSETMVLFSDRYQDQITGRDPKSIPETASLALVALGLIAAGVARRRRT